MLPFVEESLAFLRSVGFDVVEADALHPKSFVRGVWMDAGRLVFHAESAHASDVLHEAGHLATVPSELRGLTFPGSFPGPRLAKAVTRCVRERPFVDELGREDPVVRGILQMGDCEASAWSFAAAVAIGMPPEQLIAPRVDGSVPYEDPELARAVLDGLLHRGYFGINGLAAAGFCKQREFPTMLRWLAP
jgi:hypothetical protein